MAIVIGIVLGAVQLSGSWIACPAGFRRTETYRTVCAPTPTTRGEAQPFLGLWTSLVQGPAGPTDVTIEITVDEGKVVVTVGSDVMGENRVEHITTENGIALHYTAALWGYSAPIVLMLSSEGDRFRADFSIMNGWFDFGGVATKKQAATRP